MTAATLMLMSGRVMDSALAERLSGMDPRTREAIIADMTRLADLAESVQGPAAFVCSREDAALHEAGHAVYEASVGQPVATVKIYHETVGGRRSWLGHFRSRDTWEVTPTSAPEADLDVARMLVAGWMAEFVCQAGKGKFRTGSSLDEMSMFKGIVITASHKLGVDHVVLAHQQLAVVGEIMLRHEAALRSIAAALIARGSLKGERLARLLAPVRHAAAA